MSEDIGARSAKTANAERTAAFEELLDAFSHGFHPLAEFSPAHRAVAYTVPVVEHQLGRRCRTRLVRLPPGRKASSRRSLSRPRESPSRSQNRYVAPGCCEYVALPYR